MLVRFKKSWRMYQPGEVAGFEPEVAQPLIAGGFAVDVDVEEAAEAATDAPVSKVPAKGKGKAKGDGLPVQGDGADTVVGAGA